MNKSAPMEYEKAIEYIDQMIRDGELVTGSRLRRNERSQSIWASAGILPGRHSVFFTAWE